MTRLIALGAGLALTLAALVAPRTSDAFEVCKPYPWEGGGDYCVTLPDPVPPPPPIDACAVKPLYCVPPPPPPPPPTLK